MSCVHVYSVQWITFAEWASTLIIDIHAYKNPLQPVDILSQYICWLFFPFIIHCIFMHWNQIHTFKMILELTTVDSFHCFFSHSEIQPTVFVDEPSINHNSHIESSSIVSQIRGWTRVEGAGAIMPLSQLVSKYSNDDQNENNYQFHALSSLSPVFIQIVTNILSST